MDEKQKQEFWEVKRESESRRLSAFLASLVGLVLTIGVLIEGGITAGLIAAVVAIVTVAAAKSKPKELPEPSLELIDEKYRAKAVGPEGINALALIAAFRDQENARSGRLLIGIGVGFAVLAIAIRIYSQDYLSVLISSAFAVLFVAWGRNVKNVRLKGFGLDVATSEGDKKQ